MRMAQGAIIAGFALAVLGLAPHLDAEYDPNPPSVTAENATIVGYGITGEDDWETPLALIQRTRRVVEVPRDTHTQAVRSTPVAISS